jgi:hypothetical protein
MLVLLTGCADSPPWAASSRRPTATQIRVALERGENYLYFPGYAVYQDRAEGEFIYREDGVWVTRRAPPAWVPLEVLLASPSVPMDFHDTPDRHNDEVVQAYPRNWGRPAPIMASVP